MKRWLHKIEKFADRAIPYVLILLLILIIGEVFYSHKIEPYSFYVSIVDGIIIAIFVVDLSFKYVRTKKVKKFFRKYWLEIIAILPAFLIVRVVEEFFVLARLEESIVLSQEALEVEARTASKASRLHYFARFAKPLARMPRFFKAFEFYERPVFKI